MFIASLLLAGALLGCSPEGPEPGGGEKQQQGGSGEGQGSGGNGSQEGQGQHPASDPRTVSLVFLASAESHSFLWPFETPTVGTVSSSMSTPSYSGQEVALTLPAAAGGYVFTLKATGGIARNSGSSQGLKCSFAAGDGILLPALEGRCLRSVTLVSGGSGTISGPCIQTPDGKAVAGGEMYGEFSGKGDSYTWNLFDTELGKAYRLCSFQGGQMLIQQLILVYDTYPIADPAGAFVEENLQDTIPDFSRVGYRYGDEAIPDYPVKITLQAPTDGSDATSLIQGAINSVATPGAVLLKAGTYNIEGTIVIERDGVVLRGEGSGTILYSTATTQISSLVRLGTLDERSTNSGSRILGSRTAVGQMYVAVANPERFSVGEKVFIFRPGTDKWIEDLHMNEIPPRPDGGEVIQWKASGYNLYWERTVTAVDGYKIWLDNPVVMELSEEYGGGMLYKGSWKRISGSGIEDLALDTRYDESVKNGNDFVDEEHCWSAIVVRAAQDCWVRRTESHHFGYASVALSKGAKHVTVQGCKSYSPVSIVTGSRRYAFVLGGGQMCLVRDCWCEDDRHQYVTGGRVCGPNVYLDCTAVNVRNDAGPHCYWSTGCLFDNVKTDGALNVQDRHWYGTGHGWTAASFVCWNCETSQICVQSPWVSGINWAIGCTGTRRAAARTYDDNLGPRPDGIWISPGEHVTPRSLYESQLSERHAAGVRF